jgi:hypothetical protein
MGCDGMEKGGGRTKRGVFLQCSVKVSNKAGGQGVFNRLRAASEVPGPGGFFPRACSAMCLSLLLCAFYSLSVSRSRVVVPSGEGRTSDDDPLTSC